MVFRSAFKHFLLFLAVLEHFEISFELKSIFIFPQVYIHTIGKLCYRWKITNRDFIRGKVQCVLKSSRGKKI